ncbi:MAG TPA: acyl-CoA dehydrogenase family protein, partial [Bradyrhizobium sp.]|nr:acyl-CoA dehydrogenase family protein [Bradyrhizobium sp.]
AEKCPPSAVRAVLDGKTPYDRHLWKGLAEMGFIGVAIPETYGGTGAGHLELCVIAEEMGRALAPVPFSSTVYLAAEAILLAGSEAQKRKWLPLIASGEAIGTLALFEGSGNPSPQAIKLTAANGVVDGVKKPVPDGAIADFAIVAARTGSSGRDSDIALFIVDMKAGGVEARPLNNVDPSRGQAEVTFKNCRAEPLGAANEGWSVVSQVLDRAAVLLAFEQVGGSDRALEMGRDYALDRIAFGRPIGSFQAIKHMLADMYVSATLARSNCFYGAWALSTNSAELPEAAAAARISATQAFQHCAKNNIQVHGGMGFTWEFDCHLYYRRANATALALGSLSYWEDALIDRMRKRNAA